MARATLKSFNFEPFPLVFAKQRSQNRDIVEWRKFVLPRKPKPKSWINKKIKRYATVQIVRTDSGWRLAYEGKPCTGPFKTRQLAIRWFVKGGR